MPLYNSVVTINIIRRTNRWTDNSTLDSSNTPVWPLCSNGSSEYDFFASCEVVSILQKTSCRQISQKFQRSVVAIFQRFWYFKWHFKRDYHTTENITASTKILIPPSSSPREIQLFHIQHEFVDDNQTQLCFFVIIILGIIAVPLHALSLYFVIAHS